MSARKRRKLFLKALAGQGAISQTWLLEAEWEFESINVHWDSVPTGNDPFSIINIPHATDTDYNTLVIQFDPFIDGKNGIPVQDWACAGFPFRISEGFQIACPNVDDQDICVTVWVRSVD